MKNLDYVAPHPDTGGWKDRHKAATLHAKQTPMYYRDTLESSVGVAIYAWCAYAQAHEERFESQIGDDYVLGPAWARWGFALRELLNGDLGRLDGGTLDTIIHDNLKEQGFDPDQGAP